MEERFQRDQNQILLRGEVGGEVRFSHFSHGESFYQFPLRCRRLSGNLDVVNVLVNAKALEGKELAVGQGVEIQGSVRTFNNRSGVGSRLVITVLTSRLIPSGEEHANQLRLRGTLCRRGEVRRTPLGREICDFTLAVNRRYGRSDYLPCIAWGSVAQRCAGLEIGQRVELEGRLQSRSYLKQLGDHSEERVAYEVSVMALTAGEE